MGSKLTMRGSGGELRVGHAVAARLRRWTVAEDMLTADNADVDPFWSTEPGSRSVRLPFGKTWWIWREVRVESLEPLAVRLVGSPELRG